MFYNNNINKHSFLLIKFKSKIRSYRNKISFTVNKFKIKNKKFRIVICKLNSYHYKKNN